jgi:hypothetical protein
MTMPTTIELSGYVPNPVREGMDFTLYEGRTILVLKDPRGKRLDWVLERDQAQNRIAGGLR